MVSQPLVTCGACDRAWHSPTMADGLRLVGSCPRCGGELSFFDDAETSAAHAEAVALATGVAPHLVLGTPRR